MPELEIRARSEESSSSLWEAGDVKEIPIRTLAIASVA